LVVDAVEGDAARLVEVVVLGRVAKEEPVRELLVALKMKKVGL
jgi:hypothetical protein